MGAARPALRKATKDLEYESGPAGSIVAGAILPGPARFYSGEQLSSVMITRHSRVRTTNAAMRFTMRI